MKEQTFNIQALGDPPRIESEFARGLDEKVRKFDEYESREPYAQCGHCPDEANWHRESELLWDDECGCYLCERCLREEEEAREAEADKENIIENEKKFHHKGGL